MSPLLIVCCSLAFLVYYIIRFKKSPRQIVLPPGPRGLPLLGNVHQIISKAPLQFSQWAKQYGKLYTIYMVGKPALVINDAVLIKQLFGMPASTGKFSSPLLDLFYEGEYGLINTDGRVWQEQRNFLIKSFKNCGGTSSIMEPLIMEELGHLCDTIKNKMSSHGRVHFNHILKKTTWNILLAITTGNREQREVSHLLEEWLQSFQKAANSGLLFFSWLRFLAPKMSGYTSYVQSSKNIRQFLWKYFEDRLKAENYQHDLISVYLKHVHEMTDKESSFYGTEGLKQSFNSVVATFIAGTETTASTMNFIIFYLSFHPDIQAKVQKEIEAIIGDRDPRLEDRHSMPYADAVIVESFRLSSILPYGLVHKLLEDISFNEYRVPRGSYLIANLYHAHYDQNVWGDPENFRPERFIDNMEKSPEKYGGKNNLKNYVIGFQPGKRTCPGEPLARDVLFLFVAKLLKMYSFSGEKGREKSEYMQPDVGIAMLPKDLPIIANVRE